VRLVDTLEVDNIAMSREFPFRKHEALDQFGAPFGPLLVAAVLAHRGNYRFAFAILVVPAVITYSMLIVARLLYPRPEEL
jgi:hypothetical protein